MSLVSGASWQRRALGIGLGRKALFCVQPREQLRAQREIDLRQRRERLAQQRHDLGLRQPVRRHLARIRERRGAEQRSRAGAARERERAFASGARRDGIAEAMPRVGGADPDARGVSGRNSRARDQQAARAAVQIRGPVGGP